MTLQAATVGNFLSPTFGMYPASTMSQYMDANTVFENTGNNYNFAPNFGAVAPMPFGAVTGNYYDMMANNSDNMTSLSFKQRSNYHALGSYNEIIHKNMTEMANALRSGEHGKASQIYDETYQAISRNYGTEMMTHEQRLNADQSIKATITKLYQQVNGYPLVNDIHENGDGYFVTGFMQGLTLGNHHKNSAEETESYMTGNGIENYSGKKCTKTLGKIVGGVVGVGGVSAIGAGAGAAVAAVAGIAAAPAIAVGAAIAGVGALIHWAFSDNSTDKVTEA